MVGVGVLGAFTIISVAINRYSIIYIVGVIYGYLILESIFLICPKCRKRPVSLITGLPDNCPHCGLAFPSIKNGFSIKKN